MCLVLCVTEANLRRPQVSSSKKTSTLKNVWILGNNKLCPPFIILFYFYKYSLITLHFFLLFWGNFIVFLGSSLYFLEFISSASVPCCSSSSILLSVEIVSGPILLMVPSYSLLIPSIPCHSLALLKFQVCNKITAVCRMKEEIIWLCPIVPLLMTWKNNIRHHLNYLALLACHCKNCEKEMRWYFVISECVSASLSALSDPAAFLMANDKVSWKKNLSNRNNEK